MPESKFNLTHHGDEVIVTSNSDQHLILDVKVQTSQDTFRKTRLQFETQSQCERLLPSIMKALK